MRQSTVNRITLASFVTSLLTIVAGVALGLLSVWGVLPSGEGLVWRLLASDAIVFAGAVLTNLAVACYRKPGG